MLKKNLRVVTALFLIALITFSSITLLDRMGRGLKVDLTEDRIYTLSDETKKIIGGLSHAIRLKLFYSRTEAMKGLDSLRPYNNYFFYVRDLLREYASAARGKVILEIIDPKEDTREEREALAYGLRPIPTTDDDRFFFGLVLTTEFGQERTIALLAPERQQQAEYDITEMIYSAAGQAKKRIGILSTLHADATAFDVRPQRAGSSSSDSRLTTMSRCFRRTAVSFQKLDAVMVIHPRALPDPTLTALDQYVLGGGKLVVFQDPYFTAAPARRWQCRCAGPERLQSQPAPFRMGLRDAPRHRCRRPVVGLDHATRPGRRSRKNGNPHGAQRPCRESRRRRQSRCRSCEGAQRREAAGEAGSGNHGHAAAEDLGVGLHGPRGRHESPGVRGKRNRTAGRSPHGNVPQRLCRRSANGQSRRRRCQSRQAARETLSSSCFPTWTC